MPLIKYNPSLHGLIKLNQKDQKTLKEPTDYTCTNDVILNSCYTATNSTIATVLWTVPLLRYYGHLKKKIVLHQSALNVLFVKLYQKYTGASHVCF
jgi:hypothetical protein